MSLELKLKKLSERLKKEEDPEIIKAINEKIRLINKEIKKNGKD